MLKTLYIQNYALIEELSIAFEPGFSVITGETGAGKSIILGAIGLLLGQRADAKAIKTGAQKCIVEACFRIANYELQPFFEENDIEYDAEECILRREVAASGKSRAFINDSPVSLALMKELGEKLIDIHSQHQNLLINKEGFQINVLDILAHDEAELHTYKEAYSTYQKALKTLEQLREETARNRQEEDYLRFQLEQLDEADLREGEQAELETEAETLSHAEDIKAGLFQVSQALDGEGDTNVNQLMRDIAQQLLAVRRVYQPAGEWYERINSCLIEVKELTHEMERALEEVDFNPARLDYVNQRLNTLYSLEQKHRMDSVEQLIELRENYRRQLEQISSADDRISELEVSLIALRKTLLDQAAVITRLRQEAARKIRQKMEEYLIPLGMPNVRFEVEITPRTEPESNGMDNVCFLFSANKNGSLQNVASIASGGEIARVMLSLKAMIAGAVKLPTIIFDEIDTGVSGSIAEKMAFIMRDMGRHDRQVISITHLPQIAARGSVHYKVYKRDTDTETVSHIRRLTHEERIEELANMLSGATLTDAAINNAKALLENN